MMKPTLLLSACAMLVSVAIGAAIDQNGPDDRCRNKAIRAQDYTRLPEMDKYKYVVNGLSGSDAKAVFLRQADELSADKTYLFSANLAACKPSYAFSQTQVQGGADNKATSIKTVYDLSLEVGVDPVYARLFKNLPIVPDGYSISGGDETVITLSVGANQSERVCVVSVGWKCDGHFQLYDGDEVVAGMRFRKTFFPVSVDGQHLFLDYLIYD